jgi:hypothetical protein
VPARANVMLMFQLYEYSCLPISNYGSNITIQSYYAVITIIKMKTITGTVKSVNRVIYQVDDRQRAFKPGAKY